ncbi:hypothetical protein SSGG_04144 [Streptomyces filamentosus NRRL 15998]|nr:hypothetical protein SSGG_04144 [Streptomyces filamentosus NRRL 15998]
MSDAQKKPVVKPLDNHATGGESSAQDNPATRWCAETPGKPRPRRDGSTPRQPRDGRARLDLPDGDTGERPRWHRGGAAAAAACPGTTCSRNRAIVRPLPATGVPQSPPPVTSVTSHPEARYTTGVGMTRTKKTFVAAAFAVALGLGSASPALADQHATGDVPVTTQDQHAT